MATNLADKLKKVQTVNPWGFMSLLLFILLLSMMGYYGYLTLQAKKLNNTLIDKQTLVQQEKMKLNTLKQDVSYVRFQGAELITNQFYGVDWKLRYDYLIAVLNMLRELDVKSWQAITFSDINVQDDKITLRWEVSSMQRIYASWGLIDQFVWLDFVEHITIPFYRRSGDLYEFILDATIKTYDTAGGQI